jgi:hypothetical protein
VVVVLLEVVVVLEYLLSLRSIIVFIDLTVLRVPLLAALAGVASSEEAVAVVLKDDQLGI